jgi:DNA recombination protein RmuC
MSSELGEVKQLVATLQKERASQHGQLVERLESTAREQRVLAETTGQLRQALASPKSRGQWGERMADDVLRSAGFVEGINYRKQAQLPGGTTPDFSFLLPDEQLLHMDVKFPIDNYLRYLEAESDDERSVSQKRFARDVRDRIKELQARGYADSDSTVGYLLLFIPNESVYGFIHEHDGDLLDFALGRRVVLCSPTTLFAVLGVVRQSVDNFMVERTSEEILRVLASFGDEWEKFTTAVDKVEKHLNTLNNSFGEVTGPRRRQLQKQIDHVDDIRSRSELEASHAVATESADLDDSAAASPPRLRDVTAEAS